MTGRLGAGTGGEAGGVEAGTGLVLATARYPRRSAGMTDLYERGYDGEGEREVTRRWARSRRRGAQSAGRRPARPARAYWSLSQRIVPSVTEKSSEPGCNWPFASP